MIIDNSNKVFETNMSPDKSMAFGISDVSLVMEVLSTLYKHSVRTLVQEYICNGRDAMREAGTWGKVPMKIGVPNNIEPTFKVRDYGVGISPDRMSNIFVNYGSSTKRNTNTQTGGFGIGAKSAFSYTDSFTVVSYYNGTKYTYLCYMTKEKGGCDLLSTEPTSEANGVEISVPVKRQSIDEFKKGVERCVMFWQEDIVFEGVTHGEIKQYKPVASLGVMSIYETNRDSQTIYLIDGIQYEMINEENYWARFNAAASDTTVVINVPNGFFKLSPSRENIQDTIENKEKHEAMKQKCKQLIQQKKNEILDIADIKDKLAHKNVYSGLYEIKNIELKISDNHYLKSGTLRLIKGNFDTRFPRKKRRSMTFVVEQGISSGVYLNEVVLIKTDKETNAGTLARRLNHYVLSEKVTVLISKEDLPFEKELFTKIIQSESLPLPPLVKGVKVKKATSDSVAFSRSSYGRHQCKMRDVNDDTREAILWEESMDVRLFNFYEVYEIPKCNMKDLTKKLLTTKEAQAKLLARKHEALGLSFKLYSSIKKLSHLNKVPNRDLRDYLLNTDKSFKAEHEAIVKLEESLRAKCPLMKALLYVTTTEAANIIIEEINKQLGE